ncbi:MAG: type I asparaginase [Mogibacterium sp.]|nr:type I asparaginase [Mogibacterium sp.]
MEKKKILIIHTGGTIGMVPTENGFAPKQGVLLEELKNIRDLSSPDMPVWDLIEFEPLLDSTNIRYEQWNSIADAIALYYDKYDGFVVLHGTDTLAYSASALSFMLEGLDKPVVFTGAQIPLCQLRSDGRDNLITSMMIAAGGVIREVSLCFGDSILRGNRAIKYSADGMMAFTSPNFNRLGDAGITIEYNHASINEYEKTGLHSGPLNIVKLKESRIAVIKIVPGIQFDIFEPIMLESLDGLVLETFGKGNIPDYDTALSHLISEASRCGTIVMVCTQCPAGTVSLGTYKAGSALVEAGAVSGGNMTTEAVITKLTYLLSKGLPKEDIRRLMQTDLRGELTK